METNETSVGKLRLVAGGGYVQFFCPGCSDFHTIGVGNEVGPTWSYNQDPHFPTFSPSILYRSKQLVMKDGVWTGEFLRDGNGNPLSHICHSYVREGKIQFLMDCTHDLKGQTVELPEITNE